MGGMPRNHSDSGTREDIFSLSDEPGRSGRNWYLSKEEIEEHSPSRKDGIVQEMESWLHELYCSFLQELGLKLEVGPVTAATAMILCHRFFMRQSHAKNDWQTIATACMFLSCKLEDQSRLLRDVAVVAYQIMYKWDPSVSQRIKQRDIYYKQKQQILDAEHLILVTIAFDLNIEHPYEPLVSALKRLEISDKNVAKVAWNLINDWMRTPLCLQYKPHYIAAGSLFLAAKFRNVKLPTGREKIWWLQFEVAPKLLEEVIQHMLEWFKQNKKPMQPSSSSKLTKPPRPVFSSTKSAQASIQKESLRATQTSSQHSAITGHQHTPLVSKSRFHLARDRVGVLKESLDCQATVSDCSSSISVEDNWGACLTCGEPKNDSNYRTLHKRTSSEIDPNNYAQNFAVSATVTDEQSYGVVRVEKKQRLYER